MSILIKNINIGNTDISDISDGTITGAIKEINDLNENGIKFGIQNGQYGYYNSNDQFVVFGSSSSSSGTDSSYIRTEICSQQQFVPSSSQRRATLSVTQGLIDNDYYIVTLDNVEWLTTCNLVWNVDYCLGDIAYLVSTGAIDSVYPFGIAWESGSEAYIAVGDTNQHTVKIEHLEFLDEPIGISIIDTQDAAGGTIRTINAVSLAEDTVSPSTLLSGYTAHNSLGQPIVGTAIGGQPNLQARTGVNPTTSSQTITADSGYDGLSSVQINAMPAGTAGTPTAAKGSVSNHSISVTPSVTNQTGYITGGTKTGTAATVSASELVSGNLSIVDNGTNINVINYATVSVAVPFITYYTGSSVPSSSLGSNDDIYLKVVS